MVMPVAIAAATTAAAAVNTAVRQRLQRELVRLGAARQAIGDRTTSPHDTRQTALEAESDELKDYLAREGWAITE